MPCEGGPSYSTMYEDKIKELKKKNNKLTTMLCRLCKILKVKKHDGLMSKVQGLRFWLFKHEVSDRKRVERKIRKYKIEKRAKEKSDENKKLREKALNKLTKEEIEALDYLRWEVGENNG